MKREDVKNHIPGITDEALKWLMDENGADINREKAKAEGIQKQLDAATGQLAAVQEKLKAFDGVDVDKLRGESDKLRQEIADLKDGWAFDSLLDGAIRDARGRSVKAIRGMLDVAALKASKDRSADIKAAIEGLAKENPWAFDTADPAAGGKANTGVTVNTGAEHGAGGSAGEVDGVAAAFATLNPDLKL